MSPYPSRSPLLTTFAIALLVAGCQPRLPRTTPRTGFFVEDGKCVYATVPPGLKSPPMTRPVPADPASFAAVPPRTDATKDTLEYAKDNSQVFLGALTRPYLLKDCDPDTFAVLSSDGKYSRDKSHVHYCGIPLNDADPETFKILDPPYSKDAMHAFAGAVAISVEDAESFEVVFPGGAAFPLMEGFQKLDERELVEPKTGIWGWARDRTAYYYADAKVAGADRESFEILNLLHAKDKNHVYYAHKRSVRKIPGADPSTFKLIGPGENRGRDKNREYLQGQAVK